MTSPLDDHEAWIQSHLATIPPPEPCACTCKGCHGRDRCYCPPNPVTVRLWPDCAPPAVIEREQRALANDPARGAPHAP